MKKRYRSDKSCLNCGKPVHDKFCSHCGQENIELHEDFLHLAMHSVQHYFHFDSKFFNSLVPLFTKPGFLTQEYFAGKRASHLNPISMYIFISILFFFLFTANTHINEKDIREENATATDAKHETGEAKKAVGEVKKAVAQKTILGEMPDKASAYTHTVLDQAETSLAADSASRNDAVIYPNAAAKEPAEAEKGEKDKFRINFGKNDNVVTHSLATKLQTVMDGELSSQLFKNKLVGHLPKTMFILLPLFALILKLVNWRSSKYYVEHLVYSIHVHSFLFLLASLLILLSWLLPSLTGAFKLIGSGIALWYIYRSMRNIYRSTRWRTVYKFFLLFFAYGFLLAISGLIVAVATLYTV